MGLDSDLRYPGRLRRGIPYDGRNAAFAAEPACRISPVHEKALQDAVNRFEDGARALEAAWTAALCVAASDDADAASCGSPDRETPADRVFADGDWVDSSLAGHLSDRPLRQALADQALCQTMTEVDLDALATVRCYACCAELDGEQVSGDVLELEDGGIEARGIGICRSCGSASPTLFRFYADGRILLPESVVHESRWIVTHVDNLRPRWRELLDSVLMRL